jgi:hypothetical protein
MLEVVVVENGWDGEVEGVDNKGMDGQTLLYFWHFASPTVARLLHKTWPGKAALLLAHYQ